MVQRLELDCTGTASCPRMVEDVWPIIKRHSSDVSEVLLFRTRRLGNERLLRRLPEVLPRLFSLGAFKDLGTKNEGLVQILSHYGGHLNVLFRTESAALLRALVELWPLAAITEDDALGLEQDEQQAFAAAVAWCSRSGAVFAFFHDGYPMLVFGPGDLLSSLRDAAGSCGGCA